MQKEIIDFYKGFNLFNIIVGFFTIFINTFQTIEFLYGRVIKMVKKQCLNKLKPLLVHM